MTTGRRKSAGPRRAQARSAPRSPPPSRRRGLPGVLIFFFALVAVAIAAFGWLAFGPGPGPREGGTETTVVLKRGSGLPQIAGALADAGVIRLPFVFGVLAKMTGGGGHLRAGEYAVPARASAFDVLTMIRQGRIVHHYVTVPEGFSSAQVAELLDNNPVLTGVAPVAEEGSIMPQTYDVERGESRADVVEEMQAAQTKLVDRLWAARRPGLPYAGKRQMLALASIVEKETALPAERPHVAGVYLNRLAKGMLLQADPTIIYGLTKGKPLGRSLTHADVTDASNSFNTYANAGLPPTPIANPGKASIEAALNPMKTDDLYFVADGTGGHVFAETLEQHNRNVDRWKAIAASLKSK